MTVAELIAALERYPADMLVGYFENPGAYSFTAPSVGELTDDRLRHCNMPQRPTLCLNIDD